MIDRLAADAVLLLHLAFIAFVTLGAALAVRWRWLPIVHLPAAAWGVYVELSGRICPLTWLENYFRVRAGQAGYADSFVEHYLLGLIYPEGLTRPTQWLLGGVVLVANLLLYGWVIRRRRILHNERRDHDRAERDSTGVRK